VYIEKRRPFSFEITVKKENPALWAALNSPPELHYRADSGQTSNRQTLSATDLFSKEINNDAQYDMSTAVFTAMPWRKEDGNKPCDCCDTSTASLDR
jgi:hypothetical protein